MHHEPPINPRIMNPDYKALLDQLPEKPERSKLSPYRELIRGLRQKRYTFREIANLLNTHYGLTVDHTTIVDFTKRRSSQRRQDLTPEHSPSNAPASYPPTTSQPTDQSHPTTPDRPRKRFHYDPEEGLTLSDEALNLKPKKD
jgi:hypothetical protein